MSTTSTKWLVDIVGRDEQELLADWVAEQQRADSRRPELLADSELRRESGELLRLLSVALGEDGSDGADLDDDSLAWQPVHDFLGGLSRSRAEAGFSPSETATFVLSLKQPLFARLAHLLGGDLTVDSRLGHGATFVLSVPVVHAGDDRAESQADDDRTESQADDGIADGEMAATRATAGRQVALVIDDDEAERYVSVHALRGLGLEVAEASDGESGLIAAREQRPDVIVLDLRMPGIDGFAVLQKLNETPATAAIPVVINTARPVSPPERARLTAAAAIVAKLERNPARLEATVAGLLKAPGG